MRELLRAATQVEQESTVGNPRRLLHGSGQRQYHSGIELQTTMELELKAATDKLNLREGLNNLNNVENI